MWVPEDDLHIAPNPIKILVDSRVHTYNGVGKGHNKYKLNSDIHLKIVKNKEYICLGSLAWHNPPQSWSHQLVST